MVSQRRDKGPRLDSQQRALLVAFVLSLLAHHSFLSFIPAPRHGPQLPPRKVQVDLYAPSATQPPPQRPAGVEIAPPAPLLAVAPPEVQPPPNETPLARVERRQRDMRDMRVPQVARPEPTPTPQPTPEPEPEEQRTAAATPVMPPINMHFVHLPPRADEPETVPDSVRFFAQRTQSVQEETRARVTTLEGEESPTAQARTRPNQQPAPTDGVADGQTSVDQREGSQEPDRRATQPQPQRTQRVASQGGSAEGLRGAEQTPQPPPPAPQQTARPGGENGTNAATPTVAAAGVQAPPQAEGTLVAQEQRDQRPGVPGIGEAVPGSPQVEPSPPPVLATSGQQGDSGAGGSGGGAGTDTVAAQADLDLDWTTFEQLFNEQLDRERQAFLERRRERRRMGGMMDQMDRVTAQLENFTPDVRPGNTTALNTLYHPFAEYLTAFHRKLHPFWGDGFLVSLLAKGDTDPLNDMSLWTKLEIAVNGDGTIRKVTIVHTSGNVVFDVAAINAVYEGEPYPEPPAELLSGDGRLYLRWAFYRNHSQCGVWNAEPYIIPDPPSLHEEGEPPDTEHPTPPASAPSGSDQEGAPLAFLRSRRPAV